MERRNQGINLRLATVRDIDYITLFNTEMAFETENINLDQADLRLGIAAVLSDSNLGFYLISELEGVLIGQILITKEWSDWRNAWFWWIQSVFVEPNHRLKGVYSTMYKKIVDMADREGNVCGLRLYVDRDNLSAKQVYSHLGMSQSHYDLYES